MPPKVVRAHDGFALDILPGDLEGVHDLQTFQLALEPLLHIPHDSMIIMNSEGSMFKPESVGQVLMVVRSVTSSQSITQSYEMPERASNGSKDVTDEGGSFGLLFVFHRDFLNMDLESLLVDLHLKADDIVSDSLGQMPQPGDSLVRLLDASEAQRDLLTTLFQSLSNQKQAVTTAIQNLYLHCQSISSSYNNFKLFAQESVQNCHNSLESYHISMLANEKMPVDKALTSKNLNVPARESGTRSRRVDEQRYLASYVNKDKMNEIYNLCKKVYDDVTSRNNILETLIDNSVKGTEALKEEVETLSPSDLETRFYKMEQRHIEFSKIVNPEDVDHDVLSRSTTGELPPQSLTRLFEIYNTSLGEINALIQQKNDYTRFALETLQKVSVLQTGIVEAPKDALKVDEDMRTMINMEQFKHLSRLRDLILVYTATVAEIVRRKTFSRLLGNNAHSIANLLSKLSHSEKGRRVHFRNEFANKLPFIVPGLPDDQPDLGVPVANVDIREEDGKFRISDTLPDLKMEDLMNVGAKLDEIMNILPVITDHAFNPVAEAKNLWTKLVAKISAMEIDFEKAMVGNKAVTLTDESDAIAKLEQTVKSLENRNRTLEDTKEDLERQLQAERSIREQDAAQLESRNAELVRSLVNREEELGKAKEFLALMEEDHKTANAKYFKEKNELVSGAQATKGAIEQALRRAEEAEEDLRDRIDEVDRLNAELKTTKAESEQYLLDSRALQARLIELQNDLTIFSKENSDLSKRLKTMEGDLEKRKFDLEKKTEELDRRRTELSMVKSSIDAKDKDLVELQSLWEDEKLHLDGIIASLEKEIAELTDLSERRGIALEAKTSQADELEACINELQKEQAVCQEELKTLNLSNTALKEQNEELQNKVQSLQKLLESQQEQSSSTVRDHRRQIEQLRREKDEAVKIGQRVKEDNQGFRSVAESYHREMSQILRVINIAGPNASKLDWSVPDTGMVVASAEDILSSKVEEVAKTISEKLEYFTKEIRKWQKECKAYKAFAAEKITFRSFQVGDVALFLPTRDVKSGSWAAFNIGSPGYFLDLSLEGELANMTKSRDWIVAKITGISNHVVDPKDPVSNPFKLIAGTQYFLLKVESWSPPIRQKRREKARSSHQEKKRRQNRESTDRSLSAPEVEHDISGNDAVLLSQSLPDRTPLSSISLSAPFSTVSITDASFFNPPNSFISSESPKASTMLQLRSEEGSDQVPSPPSLNGFSRILPPKSDYGSIAPAFLPSAIPAFTAKESSPRGESASVRTLRLDSPRRQKQLPASHLGKASPSTSARSGTSLFPYNQAKKSHPTTSTSFAFAADLQDFPTVSPQEASTTIVDSPTKRPSASTVSIKRDRTASQRASTSFFDSLRIRKSSRIVDEGTASELLRKLNES